MIYQYDLAERSADIHWPEGYDPRDADLFSDNHIAIDRPADAIWQHLIAATSWPEWYSNSHDVVVNDASGPGAQKLAHTNPGHMHRGHDLWNISLKFLCESQ